MNDGSIGSTFNEGHLTVEGEDAYCIDINTDFKNGYKLSLIHIYLVRSSSKISAFVEDVLWSKTMAPGWILPSSFSKASSWDGWLS